MNKIEKVGAGVGIAFLSLVLALMALLMAMNADGIAR